MKPGVRKWRNLHQPEHHFGEVRIGRGELRSGVLVVGIGEKREPGFGWRDLRAEMSNEKAKTPLRCHKRKRNPGVRPKEVVRFCVLVLVCRNSPELP